MGDLLAAWAHIHLPLLASERSVHVEQAEARGLHFLLSARHACPGAICPLGVMQEVLDLLEGRGCIQSNIRSWLVLDVHLFCIEHSVVTRFTCCCSMALHRVFGDCHLLAFGPADVLALQAVARPSIPGVPALGPHSHRVGGGDIAKQPLGDGTVAHFNHIPGPNPATFSLGMANLVVQLLLLHPPLRLPLLLLLACSPLDSFVLGPLAGDPATLAGIMAAAVVLCTVGVALTVVLRLVANAAISGARATVLPVLVLVPLPVTLPFVMHRPVTALLVQMLVSVPCLEHALRLVVGATTPVVDAVPVALAAMIPVEGAATVLCARAIILVPAPLLVLKSVLAYGQAVQGDTALAHAQGDAHQSHHQDQRPRSNTSHPCPWARLFPSGAAVRRACTAYPQKGTQLLRLLQVRVRLIVLLLAPCQCWSAEVNGFYVRPSLLRHQQPVSRDAAARG
mmetsp:Transcript_55794/g.179073  ORF Transcript_55794/g.179073 Transcript_55794/m.179073 type:complete len:452 (-) Transcript_55794:7-1362(-)